MSAVKRRYRVRFGTKGAEELTPATVDFILTVDDVSAVPVVTGSIAHPIQGATEMRPFWVQAVDLDGVMIERFSQVKREAFPFTRDPWEVTPLGRWGVVGRLVDVQWQLTADDPDADPWTTYGTGRCSGFDEGDGPGLFNVEISDESWKARKNVTVFGNSDTTQLWPAGVRPGVLDEEHHSNSIVPTWRGLWKVGMATAELQQSTGNLHQIRLRRVTSFDSLAWWTTNGLITQRLARWIKNDVLGEDDLDFTSTPFPDGNFKHLRLRMGLSHWGIDVGQDQDFEVVAIGGLSEEEMFDGIDEPDWSSNVSSITTILTIWVRSAADDPESETPSPVTPPTNGPGGEVPFGYLYAPSAPPSDILPLHIGVNNADHAWGTDGGYIHVADLHRRVWTGMDLRFDPDNLNELETDLSFPALAPTIGDEASQPEKWLERIRQNCGLIALRDVQGRLKLVDVRPLDELTYADYPEVNASNSRGHRWRVLGRETINVIQVETHRVRYAVNPPWPFTESHPAEFLDLYLSRAELPDRLDNLRVEVETTRYEGDTIPDAGERPFTFQAHHVLSPKARTQKKEELLQQERGALWEDEVDRLMIGHLKLHQDGLQRIQIELGKTLSDAEEEGSILILDHDELKGANPRTVDRTGLQPIRVMSLTRHPAYAECEAILIMAVDLPVFEEPCP